MALTHATSVRNTLAESISTAVDAGTGNGVIEVQDSGGAVLGTVTFQAPAFAAATSGAIDANTPLTDETNATSGTAAQFKVKDSDGNLVYDGTITQTGNGGDLELDNTSITSGATISISSWTYTAPQ